MTKPAHMVSRSQEKDEDVTTKICETTMANSRTCVNTSARFGCHFNCRPSHWTENLKPDQQWSYSRQQKKNRHTQSLLFSCPHPFKQTSTEEHSPFLIPPATLMLLCSQHFDTDPIVGTEFVSEKRGLNFCKAVFKAQWTNAPYRVEYCIKNHVRNINPCFMTDNYFGDEFSLERLVLTLHT